MNETEKKVVARAANGLALMALGLRNGDFMSATDIASALDDRIEQLRGLLKATSERREPGEDLNAESNIPQPKAVRGADALDIMGTILFQASPGLRRGIVL